MLLFDRTGVQVEEPALVCNFIKSILDSPGVTLEENIYACELTSFCLGGKIPYLVSINDEDSASRILKALACEKIPVLPVGAGTNMLVSDDGFNGVFIRLGEKYRSVEKKSEDTIVAGGSLKLTDLIAFLKKNKLGGLSFLCGIPGTVGGAVAMNAGAFGDEIKNHIVQVKALTLQGEKLTCPPDKCEFDYRMSKFRRDKILVLSAEFSIQPGKPIDCETDEIIAHRSRRHVEKGHYAGSVFKNPPGQYAGKLLEDSGMKGLRVGSAYVSSEHANFIFADENGKALDVLELMMIGALRVYKFYGIKLYPEIELVGFELNWDEIFD